MTSARLPNKIFPVHILHQKQFGIHPRTKCLCGSFEIQPEDMKPQCNPRPRRAVLRQASNWAADHWPWSCLQTQKQLHTLQVLAIIPFNLFLSPTLHSKRMERSRVHSALGKRHTDLGTGCGHWSCLWTGSSHGPGATGGKPTRLLQPIPAAVHSPAGTGTPQVTLPIAPRGPKIVLYLTPVSLSPSPQQYC